MLLNVKVSSQQLFKQNNDINSDLFIETGDFLRKQK